MSVERSIEHSIWELARAEAQVHDATRSNYGKPQRGSHFQHFLAFHAGVQPNFSNLHFGNARQYLQRDGWWKIDANAIELLNRQFFERSVGRQAFDNRFGRVDWENLVAHSLMSANAFVAKLFAI